MKKIFVAIIILFISCNPEKKVTPLVGNEPEVLKNWFENIILPAYKNYQTEVAKLTEVAKKFEEDPTGKNFAILRDTWFEAYKAFQRTIIFDVEEILKSRYYVAMANTYPTAPEAIEENIKSLKEEGKLSKHLDVSPLASRHQYQGFPALDYLLFEPSKDITYYEKEENRKDREYIRMLAEALEKNVQTVITIWEENKEKYINSNDHSVTGAYSITINTFIQSYEDKIRARKVGYACGAIPNQNGKAIANYIEAYYKEDVSKELLMIALQTSQNFFLGKHTNGTETGKSLSHVLEEIGRKDIVNEVNKQYESIFKELEATANNFKLLAIDGENMTDFTQRPLYKLYLEIQKNVANYKTRMLNALKVQVNYQDSDGD